MWQDYDQFYEIDGYTRQEWTNPPISTTKAQTGTKVLEGHITLHLLFVTNY